MYITVHIKKIIIFFVIIFSLIIVFTSIYYRIKPVPSSTSDMEFRVAIDPGHGSIDTGTHYNKIHEKDINLAIAKYLEKELIRANIIPIMTRTEDKLYHDSRNKDIRNRPEVARKKSADLFISIHVNNFPTSQPQGGQVFYKTNSSKSKELAEFVRQELFKLSKTNDRCLKTGNYYVLNMAPCPAILIETGFISNPADRSKLTNAEYQKALAVSIKNGIINYFHSKFGKNKDTEAKQKINNKEKNPDLSLYYLLAKNNKLLLVRKNFSYPAGTILKREFRDMKFNEMLAKLALKQLMDPPTGLDTVIPAGTRIKSLQIDNHRVVIDFSHELQSNFQGGAGLEQLIYQSITQTLFSIPGIEEIEILIAGERKKSIGGHIILDKITK